MRAEYAPPPRRAGPVRAPGPPVRRCTDRRGRRGTRRRCPAWWRPGRALPIDRVSRIGPPAPRPAVDMVLRMANVEAHITGTVWKIEVAVGDQVEEGDTVAILESMKMEMPVEAEDEGTVKAILVEEGQSVSEGDALVELE